MQGCRTHFCASAKSFILLLWLYSAQQDIFILISLIPSTAVMQDLHNKEMVMNAFAGFENWSPMAGFTLLLLGFSQHFAFIWCFTAFISWHTAHINKQQEANRGRSMDLQCPLLFSAFAFLWFSVFCAICRITPPCSSVPTNWIKRISLESLTPSWSSTEATRMARESCLCFSVGSWF